MSPQDEEAACQSGLRLAAQAANDEAAGNLQNALDLYVEAIRVLLQVRQTAAREATTQCLTKAEYLKSRLKEAGGRRYPESSASLSLAPRERDVPSSTATDTTPNSTSSTHFHRNSLDVVKFTQSQLSTSSSNTYVRSNKSRISSVFTAARAHFSSRSSSPSPCSIHSPDSSRSSSPDQNPLSISRSSSSSFSSRLPFTAETSLARSPSAPASFPCSASSPIAPLASSSASSRSPSCSISGSSYHLCSSTCSSSACTVPSARSASCSCPRTHSASSATSPLSTSRSSSVSFSASCASSASSTPRSSLISSSSPLALAPDNLTSESHAQKSLRLLNEAVAMDEKLHVISKAQDPKQSQALLTKTQILYQEWLQAFDDGAANPRVDMVRHRLKTLQCRLTPDERKILIGTSYINGLPYLPFIEEDAKHDSGSRDFESPLLQLSSKQQELFSTWVRPRQLTQKPCVVHVVCPLSIQQSVITDCSFVASISVAAQHERTFRRPLISSCIYPQDESGCPIYNAQGKYIVKLLLNGVERKVAIDDRLPIDSSGRLLCSASQTKGELWVSLVEKAFLQAMGGYDFPGSNSGIDLHILTGWVPERVKLATLDAESGHRLWERMHGGHACGDALITVATGSDVAYGLVSGHAYAVLRVEEVESVRLLQIKNPWAHTCWEGPYAPKSLRWTPKLRQKLQCERDNGSDNGIFWVDFESLLKYFDVVCINWNKELFPHKQSRHVLWGLDQGPLKDSHSFQYNPQFRLHTAVGQVYILLSRHVTDKAHELTNKEFITCHVLRRPSPVNDSDLLSCRVYVVTGPELWVHKGKYINDPHYLVRLPCSEEADYTLIISVYEKLANMSFTLSVFSTCPCTLTPIPLSYEFQERVTGTWKEGLAGGSSKNSSYFNNPQFYLQVSASSGAPVPCVLKVEAPKEFYVNAKVFESSSPLQLGEHPPEIGGTSTLYMDGVSFGMVHLNAGVSYSVVVSTFLMNQYGPFVLSVSAPFPFQLRRLM